MKQFIAIIATFFLLKFGYAQAGGDAINSAVSAKPKILVFSRTTSFYHISIPDGIAAIKKLGAENGFDVDATTNAGWFIGDTLKKYAAVIFLSTADNKSLLLNQYQEAAFTQYIQKGGGYAGIHAASDAEYEWGWYNKLVGGVFNGHPAIQQAELHVVDTTHISTKGLPKVWIRTDEWYNFKELSNDIKVLITIDERTYTGGTTGTPHPMAWYHEYDGGRAFYTALGHTKESFTEPLFLKHLLGGIKYAIGQNTVRITSPSNNTNYIAPATISLIAQAKDADGTIKKVEFYNGTTLLVTENYYPYTFTWNNVSAGTYALTAKATNDKGVVTISPVVNVTVSLPNKAPIVNITSPVNNTGFIAPATISLIAEAKDPDGRIKKVEFYNGTTLLVIENYYPYTYTWNNVSAGTYALTAKATDDRGAQTTSVVVNVTVSLPNKAPIVTITSPVNNTGYIAPATISLIADAKDPDGRIKKVEFYNGNTILVTENYYPYTYTWNNVSAGTYRLTTKATDDKGVSATSDAVIVSVIAPTETFASSSSPAKLNFSNAPVSLKVSPNPSGNILQIRTNGLYQDKSIISVISASGVVIKTIRAKATNQIIQLDVSSVASGIYAIKIVSGDKILYKPFVKL